MQPGFIETATVRETTERKEFWNAQIVKAGLDDEYVAVARQMPGIPARKYLGIFIEDKDPKPDTPEEP